MRRDPLTDKKTARRSTAAFSALRVIARRSLSPGRVSFRSEGKIDMGRHTRARIFSETLAQRTTE